MDSGYMKYILNGIKYRGMMDGYTCILYMYEK